MGELFRGDSPGAGRGETEEHSRRETEPHGSRSQVPKASGLLGSALWDLTGIPSSGDPMPPTRTLSPMPPVPGLSAACISPTGPLPCRFHPCSHRDLPVQLLQPQGEVRHLDSDHFGRTDFLVVPLCILLEDGELLQARLGPQAASQHVHTGAHEVEVAAIKGGVMGVSRCLAGGRAHSHTAQDATRRLADLVWATGGGITGYLATFMAVANGIAARSGIEGLAWRVVGALVHAAAGGQGHAGLTTEREALVAHAALVAVEAAAPRHWKVSTGQRAAMGTGLVVTVGRAAQRCRESGHQDGETLLPGDTADPDTHMYAHTCSHTLTHKQSSYKDPFC